MSSDDVDLMDTTNADDILVERTYKGPHVTFPLNQSHIEQMVHAFKSNKVVVRDRDFISGRTCYSFLTTRGSLGVLAPALVGGRKEKQ